MHPDTSKQHARQCKSKQPNKQHERKLLGYTAPAPLHAQRSVILGWESYCSRTGGITNLHAACSARNLRSDEQHNARRSRIMPACIKNKPRQEPTQPTDNAQGCGRVWTTYSSSPTRQPSTSCGPPKARSMQDATAPICRPSATRASDDTLSCCLL